MSVDQWTNCIRAIYYSYLNTPIQKNYRKLFNRNTSSSLDINRD